MTTRTDPNNHATTYAYDDASRLTSVTNPLNKTWSIGYDANGNRTSVTKPSTGTITGSYDALNRPTGFSFSDSTPSISYSYDANSNRTQMVDGAGTQTYTYNNLDRLTAVTRGSDTFTYDYDAVGNITLRTYPDGSTITSSYDDDERLASVTRSSNTANYGYNAAGMPIQITLPNSFVDSRIYDRAGRITQIKHSTGSTILNQFDYAYDAVGNPTSVTTPSDVTSYNYDNRNRLTEVCFQTSCPGGSDPFIRWTYDAVGNRLTEARPSGTTSYTYNAGDQLTQAGSTSYTYDANGNETQAGSRTLSWNLADQMVSTTSSGATTNYSYDGDGNRLQAAATSTTNYLWDVNAGLPRLAVERNGSGSALRSYEYGLGLLAMAAGGQNYYFHQDAIGSVRNLTSSSGQTEWTYSYEPFGNPRTETKNDTMAPDNTLRFAGELLDSGSGFYDLRARVYSPGDGRFLSLDPRPANAAIPYESSYVYAFNSPAAWIDPSGMGAVWHDGLTVGRNVLDIGKTIVDYIEQFMSRIKNAACGSSVVVAMTLPRIRWGASFWLAGYMAACTRGQSFILTALKWVAQMFSRGLEASARFVSHHSEQIITAAAGCYYGAMEINEVGGWMFAPVVPGGEVSVSVGGCLLGAAGMLFLPGGIRPTNPGG